MNTSLIRKRWEWALLTFFVACALSLIVTYVVVPSISSETLLLPSSPSERYPWFVTVFLGGILVFITLLMVGVLRHWRWLFWLLLVAFSCSILEIPAGVLQVTGLLPGHFPLWYSFYRMGIALIEFALWMFQIYRHTGVWAMDQAADVP